MFKSVIVCLVGIAALNQSMAGVLRRDVSHGYHYHDGHSSGGGGFLRAPVSVSSTSYTPIASGNSYFNRQQASISPAFGHVGTSGFVPSTQTVLLKGVEGGFGSSGSFGVNSGGFGIGSGTFGANSVGFGGINGGGIGIGSGSTGISHVQYDEKEQYAFQHQAPIVTKHFYIHSAPEDRDEKQIVRHINVGRPQQNYRVVFIKAPTSSVSKAKIIANVAPIEDKTAIYVIAKKSNALDVSAEVVTPAPTHHKPEVFFIKYKTPAEAEHAQHVIQAQYDSLGGSSQVTNEGVIPVSSVIGSLGGSDVLDSGASTVTSTGSSGGIFGVSTGSSVGSIGIGSLGSTSSGSSLGSSSGLDTDQSQKISSAGNVITTGENIQQTYLPAHHI